ncbi:hypothetical protein BJY04DRAFT_223612 [Aspergillus karnatakaensis]|uniref:uncharacterized protein n=1 Tax=Aspergillus karnatakaensis TaxID=1810916 RepID=UPI003CCD1490
MASDAVAFAMVVCVLSIGKRALSLPNDASPQELSIRDFPLRYPLLFNMFSDLYVIFTRRDIICEDHLFDGARVLCDLDAGQRHSQAFISQRLLRTTCNTTNGPAIPAINPHERRHSFPEGPSPPAEAHCEHLPTYSLAQAGQRSIFEFEFIKGLIEPSDIATRYIMPVPRGHVRGSSSGTLLGEPMSSIRSISTKEQHALAPIPGVHPDEQGNSRNLFFTVAPRQELDDENNHDRQDPQDPVKMMFPWGDTGCAGSTTGSGQPIDKAHPWGDTGSAGAGAAAGEPIDKAFPWGDTGCAGSAAGGGDAIDKKFPWGDTGAPGGAGAGGEELPK